MQSENVSIFCTNMLDTGTAFGLRSDNGEQVFIPATVTKRANMSIGDSSIATLIPNHQHGDRTPWFAIHIAPVGEPEEEPVPASIDDRSAAAIGKDAGAYHTTSEIADMVSVDSTTAGNALNRLLKQERVARADVYARADQQRPSFCLWAKDISRFVEVES